jgi:hypothetical protein
VLILVRHAMPAIGPDRRFEEGIVEQLASAGDRPLLVATHGMAMTVWLTARLRLAASGKTFGFRMPIAWIRMTRRSGESPICRKHSPNYVRQASLAFPGFG